MSATTVRVGLAGRFRPRHAIRRHGERLANWLGLLALLALGIVWQ